MYVYICVRTSMCVYMNVLHICIQVCKYVAIVDLINDGHFISAFRITFIVEDEQLWSLINWG